MDGMGWISPGGPRYRAPTVLITKHQGYHINSDKRDKIDIMEECQQSIFWSDFCTTNHTTFDHQTISELVSFGLTQGEKYILCESVSLHQLSKSLHFSSRLELFWIFQNLEICIRLFNIGCTTKV